MAKKKSAPAVAEKVNPFELAAVISEKVQITDVRVVECRAELSAKNDSLDELELRVSTDLAVAYAVEPVCNEIHVLPEFTLSGFATARDKRNENEAELLTISCRFLLIYEAPSVAEFPRANLEAFAKLNGVYNAWPYWREFVQNIVARMGLPRLVVPVFRFGQ